VANRKQRTAVADAPSAEGAIKADESADDHQTRALAIVPPTKRTITRTQANDILKASAVEKFHAAKRKQEASRAEFEAAFGRTDRIDDGLLRDLQALQMRFAAINARQHASSSHYGEPKVSRFVSQLGTMIGDISAHLATDRALQLFEPVRESDYIGYAGSAVGPRGLDENALSEYDIVDDVRVNANAEAEEIEDGPYEDDDEGPCLHQNLVALDENEKVCADCDESFTIAAQAS